MAALGIVKGKQTADQSVPGLVEVATAILEILPVQGSKALHDEIKVMLQVRRACFCLISGMLRSRRHVTCADPRWRL